MQGYHNWDDLNDEYQGEKSNRKEIIYEKDNAYKRKWTRKECGGDDEDRERKNI